MKKGSITFGIILILVGVILIAMQLYPPLSDWISWPMIILGIGLIFLVASLTSGNGDLAIPGFINGGIGSILLYQNITGDWESWSYMWSLILVFIGLGILVANLINKTRLDRSGFTLIVIGGLAFAIFFATENYNISSDLIWPAAIIVIGLLVVFRNIGRKGKHTELEE